MQGQQVLQDGTLPSCARTAGSPSSDDFFSASVAASPLSDSDMNSFELPAEQAGKTASPFDNNAFGLNTQDDLSGSLGWPQFLLPDSSDTWNQQDQQNGWQPDGVHAFVGHSATAKQSPNEAVKEGSTPRSSEDSGEGCLLSFQASLNSASDPAEALGPGQDTRNACRATQEVVASQHSPQQSAGQSEQLAVLVTTGSIKSAPYGKRTLRTAEERKAHRMAKNRATAAASRKRKQEAAHDLVQRQERLSRENHELLELLQGRELQIVELRKRIAAAESQNAGAWSPSSDPTSDPIDLYWQF